MKRWIFYKIYAKNNVENWYGKLLNEIVKPFANDFRHKTDCIWFNYYNDDLKTEEWKEMKCKEFFKMGDRVHFIRFRVRAEENEVNRLEREVVRLIDNCNIVKVKEKCIENTDEILSNEFGKDRVELSIRFLNICSEIVLSMLTLDNRLSLIESPSKAYAYGFLHYFWNMFTLQEDLLPNCQYLFLPIKQQVSGD